jgi:Na+/phosphate symporter
MRQEDKEFIKIYLSSSMALIALGLGIYSLLSSIAGIGPSSQELLVMLVALLTVGANFGEKVYATSRELRFKYTVKALVLTAVTFAGVATVVVMMPALAPCVSGMGPCGFTDSQRILIAAAAGFAFFIAYKTAYTMVWGGEDA